MVSWKLAAASSSATDRRDARWRRPKSATKKLLVSVRYSPEVLEYFKSTGEGWQARMDGVLATTSHGRRGAPERGAGRVVCWVARRLIAFVIDVLNVLGRRQGLLRGRRPDPGHGGLQRHGGRSDHRFRPPCACGARGGHAPHRARQRRLRRGRDGPDGALRPRRGGRALQVRSSEGEGGGVSDAGARVSAPDDRAATLERALLMRRPRGCTACGRHRPRQRRRAVRAARRQRRRAGGADLGVLTGRPAPRQGCDSLPWSRWHSRRP